MSLTPHQNAGRVIRLMGWLSALMSVGILVAVGTPLLSSGGEIPGFFVLMFAVLTLGCAFTFIAAHGLLRGKAWGKAVGIAYGVLCLPGFPIGTLIGAYVLWQLAKGWNASASARVS